jgi:hypothetical protein
MPIQHRLVAQRRPGFGNEHQSAFAPREMLFQHFRYVRLNVDCPLWFLGRCGIPLHMLRRTCTTWRDRGYQGFPRSQSRALIPDQISSSEM